VYARLSNNQQEQTAIQQVAWAEQTVQARGCDLAAEPFIDTHATGAATTDRDALQALFAFVEDRAATNPVRVVFCWSLERLTRFDYGVLNRLRAAGVWMIATHEKVYALQRWPGLHSVDRS
jgi:DNA invertase Pin-like site-specific DNA recombinase